MKTLHLNAAPELLAAQSNVARLSAELVSIDAQILTLENAGHVVIQRDPLSDALALVDGKAPTAATPDELARLRGRRNAIAAGLRLAQEAVPRVHKELSAAYMRQQAPSVADALDGMAGALQSALTACDAFKAIRADAAALGVDAAAGSLPTEIDALMREQLTGYLKTVRDLAEETRDRFAPDGEDVRVVMLATTSAGKSGDIQTMPGKLARMLIRTGRAEIATAAARLRKVLA